MSLLPAGAVRAEAENDAGLLLVRGLSVRAAAAAATSACGLGGVRKPPAPHIDDDAAGPCWRGGVSICLTPPPPLLLLLPLPGAASGDCFRGVCCWLLHGEEPRCCCCNCMLASCSARGPCGSCSCCCWVARCCACSGPCICCSAAPCNDCCCCCCFCWHSGPACASCCCCCCLCSGGPEIGRAHV